MKIAIIGAGAAGCFAAANIPFHPDDEVVIFEKTGKSLQKVRISGGGRCNVTHACFEVPELIEKYPRGKQLLKKTLYQFGPKETVEWFESRGVQIKVEEDGRMFPITNDSQTIVNCIMKELEVKKIPIRYNHPVEKIEQKGSEFIIHFNMGNVYSADKIIIAAGGYSKVYQYQWLLNMGHTIEEPVPSLFTFNLAAGVPKHPITKLMGVVVQDVTVKISGSKFSAFGPLLITHWGMSGPAILKCSALAARELADKNYQFTILINWLNGMKNMELTEQVARIRKSIGKQLVMHKNPFNLPKRFWEFQLLKHEIGEEIKWGELPAANQNRLMEALINDRYEVSGKTTFKEEFVTCGGVKLSELNQNTLESRIIPGIYFAGEILDVDGITGGYNFQHAWSSGFIAATEVVVGR